MSVIKARSPQLDKRRHLLWGSLGRTLIVAWLVGLLSVVAIGQEAAGLRAPKGFQASLFADDDLAHDIHCLSIDSHGQIVVAGNGYIRCLIDNDGDGKADSSVLFAEAPASGVQGMFWHGSDLLAVGGDGLLQYRDRDGDRRADGPPDVLLKLRTGGEHHAHAIQRGPDGWWYLIAGNDTALDAKYVTLPTSPIKQPEAGVLYRIKPDVKSGGEVIAHGLRNAYDFAFHRVGDVFTFDSDDERDVSLPWYRPTRVFQLLPGSHAGWVTRSWKRPDTFFDMPPVVAAAGRGSPTGVVCYQHQQFPEKYRDALFVLDWTFGRVLALPLIRNGSTWKTESELFLSAAGDHGFAPTDAEVGPDGSLFVSVGGRGTRGGVWRITYPAGSAKTKDGQAKSANEELPTDASEAERIVACLSAPQPLSSWSRARWQPLAKQLGRDPILKAANDETLLPAARQRAIDVLTEMFGGLDESETTALAKATPAEVRAKAIWSLGRTHANPLDAKTVRPFLEDDDRLVRRFALEALLQAERVSNWSPLCDGLAKQLGGEDRFNRLTASRLITRLDNEEFQKLSYLVTKLGWRATVANAIGYLPRSANATQFGFKVGQSVLEGPHPPALKLEATRLIQLALGDVVPAKGVVPAFEAYTSRANLSQLERDLDPLRVRLSDLFPTGHDDVDRELARTLAMLAPSNTKLLDKVLAKITDESDPVEDIHFLLVAARIPVTRNRLQVQTIARALVRLDPKIVTRKLNQDLNWNDRVGELYRELSKLDPDLPDRLVAQPEFGRPGHVLYLSQLPQELLPRVIESYVKAASANDEYPWTNDVVFVLGESKRPEHRELIRKQFEQFQVRGAVLVVLSGVPEEQDRTKFVEGLEESRLEVLTACVDALGQLAASTDAAEQFALLRALRRLGVDPKEFAIRDKVARLLTRNHGNDLGFVFGTAGENPQTEVIQRWTAFLTKKHPDEAARLLGGDAETLAWLKDQLTHVNWSTGDETRGRLLFEKRSCAQCHGGGKGLGPDLAGASSRFSREDLFIAIALPNRDVAPRYQTTLVETKRGKVHSGLIVYESVEGLLLRNSTNQTLRIESSDVEVRRTLPQSLMPGGLIKDFRPGDFADLFAFLKSLGSPTAATRRTGTATNGT